MRNEIRMYLDNNLVGIANNWQGITVAMTFEDENVQPSIETDELEFVLATNADIRKWIDDGIDGGGVGIYEPPDLRIEITDGTSRLDVFNGLLDMTNDMLFVDCNTVRVKLKRKGGLNQLTERSQAISFAYLFSKGEIKQTDFVNIPYVLAHVPDIKEVLLLSLAILVMSKEIYDGARQLGKDAATVVGDIVDYPPNPAGSIAAGIALAAVDTAFLAGMTIALKKLIEEFLDALMAPVGYYKAMKLQKLLEVGAEHMGYTFESTFFDNTNNQNLCILPVKEGKAENGKIVQLDGNKVVDYGFPTNKGQLYTYYDILQFFKTLINGKIRVIGTVIHIERKDYWSTLSNYTLPDVLLREYKYNASEINSNLNIEFALDERDDTTLTNYKNNKTNFQRITEPVIVNNKKNVTLKGLEKVNIAVTLPTRKDKLTNVENRLSELAKKVDTFLGTGYSAKIKDRKGALSIANDFTSVPKIVPLKGGKIPVNYRSIINAEVLHYSYYYINTFSVEDDNYSQYKVYENIKIPFCFKNFVSLQENSWFNTKGGDKGKFDKIEGNIDGGFATADFRIKSIFTKNLKDRIA